MTRYVVLDPESTDPTYGLADHAVVVEWDGEGFPPIKQLADTALAAGNQTVMFGWSKEHGECYDCGLPAAYRVEAPVGGWPATADLRCSVCAALAASEGEEIIYLFREDNE